MAYGRRMTDRRSHFPYRVQLALSLFTHVYIMISGAPVYISLCTPSMFYLGLDGSRLGMQLPGQSNDTDRCRIDQELNLRIVSEFL